MIYGPIFYRLQVGHAPADVAFVESLLQETMGGLGLPDQGTA